MGAIAPTAPMLTPPLGLSTLSQSNYLLAEPYLFCNTAQYFRTKFGESPDFKAPHKLSPFPVLARVSQWTYFRFHCIEQMLFSIEDTPSHRVHAPAIVQFYSMQIFQGGVEND